MGGWTDGQMGGWTDGRAAGRTCVRACMTRVLVRWGDDSPSFTGRRRRCGHGGLARVRNVAAQNISRAHRRRTQTARADLKGSSGYRSSRPFRYSRTRPNPRCSPSALPTEDRPALWSSPSTHRSAPTPAPARTRVCACAAFRDACRFTIRKGNSRKAMATKDQ